MSLKIPSHKHNSEIYTFIASKIERKKRNTTIYCIINAIWVKIPVVEAYSWCAQCASWLFMVVGNLHAKHTHKNETKQWYLQFAEQIPGLYEMLEMFQLNAR